MLKFETLLVVRIRARVGEWGDPNLQEVWGRLAYSSDRSSPTMKASRRRAAGPPCAPPAAESEMSLVRPRVRARASQG